MVGEGARVGGCELGKLGVVRDSEAPLPPPILFIVNLALDAPVTLVITPSRDRLKDPALDALAVA